MIVNDVVLFFLLAVYGSIAVLAARAVIRERHGLGTDHHEDDRRSL